MSSQGPLPPGGLGGQGAVSCQTSESSGLLGHRHPRKGMTTTCLQVPRCPDPRGLGPGERFAGDRNLPRATMCRAGVEPPAPAGPDTPTKQSPLPGHTKRAPRVLAGCRPCPQAAQAANSPLGPACVPRTAPGTRSPLLQSARPGGSLSPFRTHPEGHPQQLASFSGTATELSELRRRRPSRSGGAVRPPPT